MAINSNKDANELSIYAQIAGASATVGAAMMLEEQGTREAMERVSARGPNWDNRYTNHFLGTQFDNIQMYQDYSDAVKSGNKQTSGVLELQAKQAYEQLPKAEREKFVANWSVAQKIKDDFGADTPLSRKMKKELKKVVRKL